MFSTRLCTLVTFLSLAAGTLPALAQDNSTALPQDDSAASQVRGTDDTTTQLIHDLIARSPSGRDLVDKLDRSDLTVYVRRRLFTTTTLNGRIGFVQSDCGRRLVVVEIAAPKNYIEELTALGHELQHAVEIASDPAVCGAASLSTLYARIGDATDMWTGASESFETRAAAETSIRVRRELFEFAAHED